MYKAVFLIREVCFDLKRHRMYYLSVIIFLLCWLTFRMQYPEEKAEQNQTVGELLCYCFYGVESVNKENMTDVLRRSVRWIMLFLGSQIAVLGNAEQMELNEQMRFLKCGKRSLWWKGKCIWNLITTIIYFGLGIFTLIIMSVLSGYDLLWKCKWSEIILPLICAGSWNLFLMYLALYLNTYQSIIVSVCMMVVSVGLTSPLLFGNYMMIARQREGLNLYIGYVIGFCLVVVTVFGGNIYWKKCDYFIKE